MNMTRLLEDIDETIVAVDCDGSDEQIVTVHVVDREKCAVLIQQAVDNAIALVDARWKEKQDGWFTEGVKHKAEVKRLRGILESVLRTVEHDAVDGAKVAYIGTIVQEALVQAEKTVRAEQCVPIVELLERLRNVVKHNEPPPMVEGHICGTDSGACDCICQEWASHAEILDQIDRAIKAMKGDGQ